jgi:hypothetical protein
MIIKCKFCKGTGRINATFFESGELCPSCKGAGELEIPVPDEKLTTCKYCDGKGLIEPGFLDFSDPTVCPACKGLGVIERPITNTSQQTKSNEISVPQTPRLAYYDYDIAVSYASEDWKIVNTYCSTLSPRAKDLRIFYDKYEQVGLWGTDLYDKLDEIYRTKALCCVIFISKDYARKVWTNHERKAAQARALRENREYILPVRLDDTEIPGISPTLGYIDLRKIPISKLTYMTIEKVRKLKSK